jgi:hypothetical protein
MDEGYSRHNNIGDAKQPKDAIINFRCRFKKLPMVHAILLFMAPYLEGGR